jgi:hypothetical protein
VQVYGKQIQYYIKTKMSHLLLGVAILIAVYIVGWHQIYGQFIHDFYKKYEMWLIWLSVPNTMLSIYATKLLTEYFEGKMWPNRIFTFSIGIIMFTILTTIYFNERLSLKTLTLVGLCGLIVSLQVLWK